MSYPFFNLAGVGPASLSVTSEQSRRWASTMSGHQSDESGARTPHHPAVRFEADREVLDRSARETEQERLLAPGATRSCGAGNRVVEEAADPWRTCFERDRDRILHSTAFRRLAGKTQVFIFPADHQRTRLTHALEVAQVATAISRACRLNLALTEAIALGHDCGHGPGGHAAEEALSRFLDEGFDHAVWGADVTAAPLNLCAETLDGIRNHSWSRPSPATPEGEVVALADRIAYSAHDLEDAVHAEIVSEDELPTLVAERCGTRDGHLLNAFVTDVVTTTLASGTIAISEPMGEALEALRRFNHERIYLRPASLEQSARVVDLLRALVAHYVGHPTALPGGTDLVADEPATVRVAVAYVSGMTDRFACTQAVGLLGWPVERLPRGVA